VNLEVKGTVGIMQTTTSRITLSPGPLSVFDINGSAIMIDVNEDTYCPNGGEAGCSGGARLACGIPELSPLILVACRCVPAEPDWRTSSPAASWCSRCDDWRPMGLEARGRR
jgi:hypothetical protein